MWKWHQFFQRSVTWCAVLGYAFVISGLPLGGVRLTASHTAAAAKRLAGKDRSTPFPCMNTPCGCVSARQCFTDCCCRSPAETLAWARVNGVTADVLLALQRRAAEPAEPKAGGCCATAAPEDLSEVCFEYDYLAAAGQHADEPVAVTALPAEATTAGDMVPVSEQTLVLKSVLACNGLLTEWLAAASCLPPPVVVAMSAGAWPPATLPVLDARFSGERDEPAAPPPRVG
jgi:hypothetical protein